MAHFAQIINDVVTRVIVVADLDCAGGQFPESEPAGQEFIASIGIGGEWRQTSYNGSFRDVYAGVGYVFDRANNVFLVPEVVSDAS
jgi:hypothetical protein